MRVEDFSVLIASLALIGVVVSLLLQARQLKIMRMQSVRLMQFELERMVLADPAVYPKHLAEPDPGDLKRRVFLQMWLKYVELGYHLGEFDEEAVGENARQIFGDSVYLAHWQHVQRHRRTPVATGKSKRFRQLLIKEAERSTLS